MESFSAILRLWPSMKAVAEDLGIPVNTVVYWDRRDSIPADQWQSLVGAAGARGLDGLTYEILAATAHARGRKRADLSVSPDSAA